MCPAAGGLSFWRLQGAARSGLSDHVNILAMFPTEHILSISTSQDKEYRMSAVRAPADYLTASSSPSPVMTCHLKGPQDDDCSAMAPLYVIKPSGKSAG